MKFHRGPCGKIFLDFGYFQVRLKKGHKPVALSLPSIMCIPFDKKGNILLIEQVRAKGITIELPGGSVQKGESLGHAAIRELEEETGYLANYAKPLSKRDTIHHSSYGLESISVYCLYDLCKMSPHFDEGEKILKVIHVPPQAVLKELLSYLNGQDFFGRNTQCSTEYALQRLFLLHPHIFL